MAGTKHTSECLQRARDDEPIFVLRGQDKTASRVVREWARQFRDIHTDDNCKWDSDKSLCKYNEAMDQAVLMFAYATKMPD